MLVDPRSVGSSLAQASAGDESWEAVVERVAAMEMVQGPFAGGSDWVGMPHWWPELQLECLTIGVEHVQATPSESEPADKQHEPVVYIPDPDSGHDKDRNIGLDTPREWLPAWFSTSSRLESIGIALFPETVLVNLCGRRRIPPHAYVSSWGISHPHPWHM